MWARRRLFRCSRDACGSLAKSCEKQSRCVETTGYAHSYVRLCVIMCDCVWSCAIMCDNVRLIVWDHVRLCANICDVWLCAIMCYHVWLCVISAIMCEYMWSCAIMCDYVRIYVIMCDCVRLCAMCDYVIVCDYVWLCAIMLELLAKLSWTSCLPP